MNTTLKSLTFFLGILCFYSNAISASNPHKFIDTQAQKMVSIIINNQELFAEDPELTMIEFLTAIFFENCFKGIC